MVIYELCDRKGKPVSYMAHGHYNSVEFKAKCKKDFDNRPSKIIRKYDKYKRPITIGTL